MPAGIKGERRLKAQGKNICNQRHETPSSCQGGLVRPRSSLVTSFVSMACDLFGRSRHNDFRLLISYSVSECVVTRKLKRIEFSGKFSRCFIERENFSSQQPSSIGGKIVLSLLFAPSFLARVWKAKGGTQGYFSASFCWLLIKNRLAMSSPARDIPRKLKAEDCR